MVGLLLLTVARAEPAAFALLPLGADLYIQKKPLRGAIYTLTQVAGVAAAYIGTRGVNALVLQDAETGYLPWNVLTAAGVSLTAGSYVVSVTDASNLHVRKATQAARPSLDQVAALHSQILEVHRADRRE